MVIRYLKTNSFIVETSHSPGGVIPEENCDDFFCSENKKRSTSPILNKLNIHGSVDFDHCFDSLIEREKTMPFRSMHLAVDAECQYMEMGNAINEYTDMGNAFATECMEEGKSTIPCGTGCCDTNLACAECHNISYGNSRTSSFAEEAVDDYVRMSPQTLDYVDMGKSTQNRQKLLNSNKAACKEVSGIALKHMSFAEYPLEKINRRISHNEEEILHHNERPPRAYSVGSRMEHHNQKIRIEVVANSEQNNCRVRAFSVGSKSKVPRCDLQRNILLSNPVYMRKPNADNSKTSIASLDPSFENTTRTRKSSSAPLLIHKSQNSVDRMGDLMEIDFSKNASSTNSRSLQTTSASFSYPNSARSSFYLNSILGTSPGQNSSINKLHDKCSDPIQIRKDNGYLEMRPVIYSRSSGSCDETNEEQLLVSNQNTSPKSSGSLTHRMELENFGKIETPEGYLEMSWNVNKNKVSSFKSGSPSSLTDKKLKNISKIPFLEQNKIAQCNKKSTFNKSETFHRKRLPHQMNYSLTISEEKTINTNLSEKFKNLLINFSLPNTHDFSNVNTNLSAGDYECYNYINFSMGIKPIPYTKIEKKKTLGIEIAKDDYSKLKADSNQCLKKSGSSYAKTETSDNYYGLNKKDFNYLFFSKTDDSSEYNKDTNRASKCAPTSPFSSSPSIHHSNNAIRSANCSGYELLHICSDSSLETKKIISRPNSVNSDRIFPLQNSQYRPYNVNNDSLQLSSVSSSTTALFFSSYLSQNNFDNRKQEPFKSESLNNNEDIKQKITDSVSSKGLKQQELACALGALSPLSKISTFYQPFTNTDLELHYASLDLPITSTKKSKRTLCLPLNYSARTSTEDDNSGRLSPNSNVNTNTSSQHDFTYAKIDFNQCENKKIKSVTQNKV